MSKSGGDGWIKTNRKNPKRPDEVAALCSICNMHVTVLYCSVCEETYCQQLECIVKRKQTQHNCRQPSPFMPRRLKKNEIKKEPYYF
jgi:hypothetical protein